MTRLTISEDRPFRLVKPMGYTMAFSMAPPRANMDLDHLELQSSSLSALARPAARATQTGISANFEIEGLSNIPSDGDDDGSQTHKVLIAELEFENGTRSSIPHVAPKESFASSLGPDGAVRVTYRPQSRTLMRPTAGSMFASSSSRTQITAFSPSAFRSATPA
ncbi:hypothetical protein HK405_004369 [Cladochytrium tenue]|nr:hypothetical protein HK405_004369 [Cladochytrium tenue]